MKANYPVEFLAASMTLDMGNTDKLAEFRAEAERLGLRVDPPSINRSSVAFEVGRQHHHLRAGRAERASASRRWKRSSPRAPNASSRDLADFADRINPRAVNKRVLESLAAAGAFDEFEKNRARVFPAVDIVLGRAQRTHETAAVGQSELFGGGGSASRSRCRKPSLGCRPSGCAANMRRSASSCPAIRSTTMPRC